jgi:DNA-binding LytR/AlgR family response regulator
MNIVIIEDEQISAQDLVDCINDIRPEYSINCILTSVKESITYFKKDQNIDLIFSDIQLGDGLCFEIFKEIKINAPIIFCTAYNTHALEAFKTNGIDYILKPFDLLEIENSIRKFELLTNRNQNQISQLINYFENQSLEKKIPSFLIYKNDKIIPLNINEIAIFYLKNENVLLHTFDGHNFQLHQTLEEIERLNYQNFFRANRQFIIHRKAVKDASHYFNRKLLVNLNLPFDEEIIVSKEKSTAFLEWLSTC